MTDATVTEVCVDSNDTSIPVEGIQDNITGGIVPVSEEVTENVSGGATAIGETISGGVITGGDKLGEFINKQPFLGWILVIATVILVIMLIMWVFGAFKFCKTCGTGTGSSWFTNNSQFESKSLNSIINSKKQSHPETQPLEKKSTTQTSNEVLSSSNQPRHTDHYKPPKHKKTSHMTGSGAWRYTDGDAGSNTAIDAQRKSYMTGSGAWRYTDGDAGSNPAVDLQRKDGMTPHHYREPNPSINDITNWQNVGAQRQYFDQPQHHPSVVVVQSPQPPPTIIQHQAPPQQPPTSHFYPEHHTQRRNELLTPNRQQELLTPNRQQELLTPNRQRTEPLTPNRQQELLTPNRQQELAQQVEHLRRYPPRRSHATVSPSGANSVIPSNSAGDVYTNTNASASTGEIDLAGCGNPTWNDDAVDEARILTNMGAYSSYTPSNKAMTKLVNTGGTAPMSDAQLVAIMFGGAPEDAGTTSALDTTGISNTTSTTGTTGSSSFNQKNYFANIEPQYDTLYTMHNNYDRENLLTPYV